MSLTRTTVYIDSESLKKLKKKLIDADKNMSELFREWIDKYTARLEDTIKPSVDKLKTLVKEVEEKYSIHDYGPTGDGVCFKCTPPHKQQR